jgi:hypothetical protein
MQDVTFIVSVPATSAGQFAKYAEMAAALKPFGKVAMNVGLMTRRASQEVPPGGSPWHDYTTGLPALAKKFFPHADEQPFVDTDYARGNVDLLRACAKVVRKHGMAAAFATHDPFFMPEAFFEAHPHLRGARVDHPRRSRREEFAICRDCPPGGDMLAWSVSRLVEEVPELSDLCWLTNDAGAGMCWNEWLYSGPNGPAHCRELHTGQHVANVLDAFDRGAGRTLDVTVLHANFTARERMIIGLSTDKDRLFWSGGDGRVTAVGPSSDNPVLGMLDPVSLVQRLDHAQGRDVRKVLIDLGSMYKRACELPEVAGMLFEIVTAYLAAPARGEMARLGFLRGLCAGWAGDENADDMLDALIAVHEAFRYKRSALPRFSGIYVGVSMRHVNRPLVAMPERLSAEEEAYFLPHVFNPSVHEARMDYMDFHGGRLLGEGGPPPDGAEVLGEARRSCELFNQAADELASLPAEGGAGVFRDMGVSLRMYGSIMRSIGNFCAMQIVRDRNAEVLAGPPRVHPKRFSMTGDADLLAIYECMRDEIDNTRALADLLDGGGMRRLIAATDAADEDTFMLGPDIAAQLRRKIAIMRRHWLDPAAYLAPPAK